MLVTVSTTREFIPKFNGNKKAVAGEQIRVAYKAPTIAMKEKLFPRKFSLGLDGAFSTSVEVDRGKIIKEMLVELFNAQYKNDNGDLVTIRNSGELMEAPIEFDPLIEEVYNYFTELLNKKTNEKN